VRSTWALIAVTLLAGTLRAGPALHPNPYLSADERGYTNVATRLAETGRYGRESLHWPPGAPGAFAAAVRAGISPYWVQWLAGTLLIPLVFLLAGGGLRGVIAAALVATYPPLIAVTGDLLSEPLGALWLTGAFVALARRRYALAGLLLAVAILTRANLLVLVPVLAIALGRRGLVFAVAALIPVLAWSLNAGAPISTGGGSSFFIGTYLPGHGTLPGAKAALKWETLRHSPELSGIAHARELPGERVLDAVAARHPRLDRDAALRAEGWQNLRTQPRAHPLAYARMLAAKLPRMWLTPSPRSDGLRTGPLRLWHVLLVLGALAGLRDRRVLAALLAFAAFHLVVEAIPRYALPVLPVLIATGCAGWRVPRTRRALPDWPASLARRLSRRASPSGSV